MGVGMFALRRAGVIGPTLFFVSILVFALQHLIPGDPALALSGDEHDPEVVAAVRKKYGFDQPVPVQYALWLGKVLTGDFGFSFRTKVTVLDLIAAKLPVTIELAVLSMLVALAI